MAVLSGFISLGQSLDINQSGALDAGNLFAGIITSAACAVGVLNALCVDDAETRPGVAPRLVRTSPT